MKPIPKFKTVEEAALFWENHEILDYVDKDEFKLVSSANIKKELREAGRPNPPKLTYFPIALNNKLLEKALHQSKQKQAPVSKIIQRWVEKGSSR